MKKILVSLLLCAAMLLGSFALSGCSGYDPYKQLYYYENEDGTYSRSDEHQRERCYSLDIIKNQLELTGFEFLGVFGDFEFGAPSETAERWYIAARAKK